jgi:hypothetical protein
MRHHRLSRLLSILAVLLLALVPLRAGAPTALAAPTCASTDTAASATVISNNTVCSLFDRSTQFAATGMPDNSSGSVGTTSFYPFSNGLDLTFNLASDSVVMLTFNGEVACHDNLQLGMVGLFVDDAALAGGTSTVAAPIVSALVPYADELGLPATRISLEVPVALGPGNHTVTLGAANSANQNCSEVDADVLINPFPPLPADTTPSFGTGITLAATVYANSGATFAKLIAFHVQRHKGTLTFSWKLAYTHGIVGFNLSAAGKRLNRHMIATHTTPVYTRQFVTKAKSGYALSILGKNGSVTVVVPA